MLVGPSARVEKLIPTGRICEETDWVDFTQKSIDLFPFLLKWTKNNTLCGDKVGGYRRHGGYLGCLHYYRRNTLPPFSGWV